MRASQGAHRDRNTAVCSAHARVARQASGSLPDPALHRSAVTVLPGPSESDNLIPFIFEPGFTGLGKHFETNLKCEIEDFNGKLLKIAQWGDSSQLQLSAPFLLAGRWGGAGSSSEECRMPGGARDRPSGHRPL